MKKDFIVTNGFSSCQVWYDGNMQNRSSKHQGPEDINEAAFHVFQEAVGESEPKTEKEKNQAAVELGRMGGKVGGKARAQSLSSERRTEIAKQAAAARWRRAADG